MCGGSSTSTSTVQIPPEVLARYNAVNARAETAATAKFQNYPGQFVAGLTDTQQAGLAGANTAANLAQPYYGTAAGLTLAGAGSADPGQLQTNQYMNPYTQAVVNPTMQALQQQQGQQLSQQQSEAIRGGAFGGDRSGLQRAQLQGQQNLALGQAIAPLYQQGYQQAQNVAQQQQGVGLAAQQANLARLTQAGQQFAGLGTGAQTAAMQGAQGQIAAGTVEQQTKQADLTANYQQFLQERGYDFQTAQFLANIAMGTGALSGSTTSTTQPSPFFSDERLKHDKKKIGETDDGLPIYSFKYNGDDRTQIGLMAQDVEKKKPEAVGLAPASDGHMYKTVDYDKATRPKKEYGGGLMPLDNSMGGAVNPDSTGESFARGGFALGGPSILSPTDQNALMASNYQTDAMPFSDQGMRGLPRGAMPGSQGIVPVSKGVHVPNLVTATPVGTAPTGLGDQALRAVNTGKQLAEGYSTVKTGLLGSAATPADPKGARGLIGSQGDLNLDKSFLGSVFGNSQKAANGGLIVPRHAYATDGGVDDDGHKTVIPGDPDHPGIPLDAGEGARKLAVSQANLGGDKSGTGDNLLKAANLAKTGVDLGTAAFKYFPMIFAADGGAIDRKGYAGTDGDSGAGYDTADGGSDATPAKDSIRDIVTRQAQINNVDPILAMKIAGGESKWKPNAQSDSSTAGGLFGLIDDTYHRNGGKPGLKYDPEENARVGTRVIASNQAALQKAGFEPTHGNTYLAHFFGPAGATSVMRNPDAPISQTLSNYDDAVEANRFIKNWTGSDAMRWADAKMSGAKFEAPSRGLDVSSLMPNIGRSGPGLYSGKSASQASLGDVAGEFLPSGVPTSSNFWVPALSGLGAMLSSPSHRLAGAIGAGLVGGVSGYQQQQKQQMEVVKNIFDMVKERYTQAPDLNPQSPTYGQMVLRDKFGSTVQPGQVRASVANMLTSAGIDPEPYGLGRVQTADASGKILAPAAQQGTTTPASGGTKPAAAPPAGAPAATTPKLSIEAQVQTLPDKPRDQWEALDHENNFMNHPEQYGIKPGSPQDPKVRQAAIDTLRSQALIASQTSTPVGESAASRLNTEANQLQTNLRADMKKVYEGELAASTAARTKTSEAIATNAENYATKSSEFINNSAKQEQSLMEVARLQGEGLRTGISVEKQAQLRSALRNLGIPDEMLGNLSDPTQVQYLTKIAAASVAEGIAAHDSQRAPASMAALYKQFSPNASIDTGALHLLLGQTLGDLRYSRNRAQDYIDNHYGENPNKVSNNYEKDARAKGMYGKTMAGAYSDLYLPSSEPDTARSLAASLKKQYGADYTPKIMGQEQKAAPAAAPAATIPTISSPSEAAKLPSGSVFIDPNGVQRRVP